MLLARYTSHWSFLLSERWQLYDNVPHNHTEFVHQLP